MVQGLVVRTRSCNGHREVLRVGRRRVARGGLGLRSGDGLAGPRALRVCASRPAAAGAAPRRAARAAGAGRGAAQRRRRWTAAP